MQEIKVWQSLSDCFQRSVVLCRTPKVPPCCDWSRFNCSLAALLLSIIDSVELPPSSEDLLAFKSHKCHSHWSAFTRSHHKLSGLEDRLSKNKKFWPNRFRPNKISGAQPKQFSAELSHKQVHDHEHGLASHIPSSSLLHSAPFHDTHWRLKSAASFPPQEYADDPIQECLGLTSGPACWSPASSFERKTYQTHNCQLSAVLSIKFHSETFQFNLEPWTPPESLASTFARVFCLPKPALWRWNKWPLALPCWLGRENEASTMYKAIIFQGNRRVINHKQQFAKGNFFTESDKENSGRSHT